MIIINFILSQNVLTHLISLKTIKLKYNKEYFLLQDRVLKLEKKSQNKSVTIIK